MKGSNCKLTTGRCSMYTNDNKQPQWDFPGYPSGSGPITQGLNTVIQDSFREKPLDSLIRECCQNSLDASANNGKPVRIEFHTFEMLTSDLPGIGALKKHIKSCLNGVNKSNNEGTKNPEKIPYETANRILNDRKLLCLRISDFNTTGLPGSRKPKDIYKLTQWYRCVETMGCSGDKEKSSGGSKGVGKSTAFYNSGIRTVFFNTLDQNGDEASEGVSWQTSHYDSDNNECTQGFYACKNQGRRQAIYAQTILDNSFKRNEPGTDLFIIGFNQNENEFGEDHDLDTVVKNVVVDSFLPAIKAGNIIIKTERSEISRNTLPDIIKYLSSEAVPKKRIKQAKSNTEFNSVIDSEIPVNTLETDSLGIKGKFEIKLLAKDDYCKKIAVYREIGMKIKEFKPRKPFGFAGVLIIKGPDLNEFMKNMETSAHNDWHPDIYNADKEQLKIAKQIKDKLTYFVKECVENIKTETNSDDKIDSGLGALFPDSNDSLKTKGESVFGLDQFEDKKEFIFKNSLSNKENTVSYKKNDKEPNKISIDKNGDINDKEFRSTTKRKKSSHDRTESISPNNTTNKDNLNKEIESKFETVKVNLSNIKFIPLDNEGFKFRVSFIPEVGYKTAMIRFNVAGETTDYSLPIAYAENDKGPITIEKNSILFGVRLTRNKPYSLVIKLEDNTFKSFSVVVDAYKKK